MKMKNENLFQIIDNLKAHCSTYTIVQRADNLHTVVTLEISDKIQIGGGNSAGGNKNKKHMVKNTLQNSTTQPVATEEADSDNFELITNKM